MSDLVLQRPVVVGGLAACAAGLAAYGLYRAISRFRQTKIQWVEVGRLSSILIHPVKACRGIEVTEADCTSLGIRSKEGLYDRHYIILGAENRFVTMRQNPALALISTSLSEDAKFLQLDAPDMPTVKVPLHQAVTNEVVRLRVWGIDAEGYNCGKEVETWLDTYLKSSGYKLVGYTTDLEPCKNVNDTKWGSRAKSHEKSVYQDLSHCNVASLTSLEELNARLDKNVTMRNFRPNLIVGDVKKAWDEDNWKYVRVGDNMILRRTHSCGRCKQTTVDPETGIVGEEPLKTLKQFRRVDRSNIDYKKLSGAPVFGVEMNCESHGSVAVGDVVYAAY